MNARSHTTATPTPATTAAHNLSENVAADPVVILAMQIREKRELFNYLDERGTAASRDASSIAEDFYEDAAKDAYDAEVALRDSLCSSQASTLEGAAIHLAEVISRFDSIWSQIDESSLEWAVKRDARAVDRLLYSALNVVLGATAHRVADIAGENFDNQQCNPWTRVSRALALEDGK